MKRIYVAENPTEAHLLKGVLESRGISVEIRGEALFGIRGEIPFTEGLPELWVVDDQQTSEALQVLRARSVETGDVTHGESWRCSTCGETVESQFTACWRCNADRPH